MDQVRLEYSLGASSAALREIRGLEELAVEGSATVDAVGLLDALLVEGAGDLGPGEAARLSAPDRDRLLAAVYLRTFGRSVESTLPCAACGKLFDLDFLLEDLLAELDGEAAGQGRVERSAGRFRLADGRAFRLPTWEDEREVLRLPAGEAEAALLHRCVLGDGGAEAERFQPEEAEEIQRTMETVAPILDLELDARCPECGTLQAVHLDLQHYLLTALRGERSRLAEEVHRLASEYGWSLAEILGLPRSLRRGLVDLVESHAARGRR